MYVPESLYEHGFRGPYELEDGFYVGHLWEWWEERRSGEKRDGVVRRWKEWWEKSRSGKWKWEKEMEEGWGLRKKMEEEKRWQKIRREGDDRIDGEVEVYKEKQQEGSKRKEWSRRKVGGRLVGAKKRWEKIWRKIRDGKKK
jgi:hypothetical protein